MKDSDRKPTKKWRKPMMQTMSQKEVENAVSLNACSNYSCAYRALRTF